MNSHEELLHQYINTNTIKDIEETREQNYQIYKNTPSLIKLVSQSNNPNHHKTLQLFYHANPHKDFNNNEFYKLLQLHYKTSDIYSLLNYCNHKKIYPTYNEWLEYLNHNRNIPLEWYLTLKEN